MQNKRQTMCLFFPEPMTELDTGNVLVAGVTRVQLFLGVAHDPRQLEQLQWLAAHGIHVILRIEEPSRDNAGEVAASYYQAGNRPEIARKIGELQARVPGLVIEAAIAGNEPDIEYNLTRGSNTWGDTAEANFPQGRVWEHRLAVEDLRTLLTPMGVLVVAPGWSHKRLTPRDAPDPGRMTWARIVADIYNQGPVGLHAYCINYSGPNGPEDENRLLWRVGNELERIHSDVWINEINVASRLFNNRPVDRMLMVLEMYDLLAAQPWTGAIRSFCPFVSNGRTDQPWSNMIMRERECYVRMGAWIAG
ncbi:MAG: hypothetical protein WCD37_06955 [Chloroflexia bacterium]